MSFVVKKLLCYHRFLEMDEREMTISLALMAKRYSERRRKEAFDMTPAEGRQVIDLVMEIMDVVKSVANDESALKNSDWTHWLGARLQNHIDKSAARSPYVYSLAFFVYKWNEKSAWKKDLILKEVERDRLQCPAHRRWRGQTFELKDFDEPCFRTELMTRKQFETKRKRQSLGSLKAKRQLSTNKKTLKDLE